MRKFLRLVVVLVLLVLVAGGVLWYYIDAIAKTGVEQGATYALGVPTTLGSADVGLLGGTLRLNDLTVANPAGFKTPHLLAVRQFDLAVVTNTLMQDTIQINRFELDGVDLHIEQKAGATNMDRVLEHIKTKAGGGEPGEPDEAESGGKKVVVDRIVVRNVTAHVQVLPIGGDATTLDVEVPEIILEDVASDDAQGVAVAELTRRLLPAILTAVITKGRGTIPDVDLDRLAGNVGDTTRALGEKARGLVEQVGKDAGGLMDKIFKPTKGEGGLLDDLLKPKTGEGDKKEGGLLDDLLKPKTDDGDKKEGGLLDDLLKPKTGDGDKKEGGLLDDLFKKNDNP